jgi:hypothetical protein
LITGSSSNFTLTTASSACYVHLQAGPSALQDITLILFSAVYYLALVLDSFWRENGYQLLVCMGLGFLNIATLLVYGITCGLLHDPAGVAVVAVAILLQTASIGLARFAYKGFGWRMYSKIAADVRLQDSDERCKAALRLDFFNALVKLNLQVSEMHAGTL